MKHWQSKVFQVAGKGIKVWPNKADIEQINSNSMYAVEFHDLEHYHSKLKEAILERENDPRYGLKLFRGACGVKIHHVDRWKTPAANLIHQRALALFSAVSGIKDPVSDMSWANVYRNGDYCLPHSQLSDRGECGLSINQRRLR